MPHASPPLLNAISDKMVLEFFGKPILRDIGEYVDFQKIEDEPKVEETPNEEV